MMGVIQHQQQRLSEQLVELVNEQIDGRRPEDLPSSAFPRFQCSQRCFREIWYRLPHTVHQVMNKHGQWRL